MFKRGLALSLVLGLASVARADVEVRLVPSPSANPYNPAGYYDAAEADVSVDVYLSTDGGQDLLLRHVQFNLDGTDAALGLTMPVTHVRPIAGDIAFWDFSSLAACTGDVEQCGVGHYIDDSNAAGPAGIATTFYSSVDPAVAIPADTDADSGLQVLLPSDGSCVLIGTLNVNIPAGGPYTLDLVNTAEADPEFAGRVSYGFELAASLAGAGSVEEANDLMAVTTNGVGAAALTGGTLVLDQITQQLATAAPVDGGVLPRLEQNLMTLDFSIVGNINVPLAPAACNTVGVAVQGILPGGLLGADIAGFFNCWREDDGSGNERRLRIQDTANTLTDETWYRISDLGGSVVAGNLFEVDQRVVYGDVNSSSQTDVTDITQVLANRADPAPFDSRQDVNASGGVDVTDVTLVLSRRGSTLPADSKPAVCGP